ncbi:uncharacterized protein [Nicotiana sylvestris]|uniref:uncharacterized protein n=1 Tax=Nicotiana sylvestris TaxID=4096 RepID=UPI00388CAA68
MKNDIVEYVSRCLNCQQMKYEHQRPDSLLQRLEILEWKWELIRMDFVVGLPQTLKKFDAMWALYGRRCRSLVGWFQPGEARLLGTDLVQDALEKVKLIQDKIHTLQSRQKIYGTDRKVRNIAFMVREEVLLRVSPMKGVMRFGKNGNLSPRYISPFEILERVGEVAYKIALPPKLSLVHQVFHAMLQKYYGDPSHILDFSSVQLDKDLTYVEESMTILDRCSRFSQKRTRRSGSTDVLAGLQKRKFAEA